MARRGSFVPNIFPLGDIFLSAAFKTSASELFGMPSLADLKSLGTEWQWKIVATIETQIFDTYHFISIHCGADTSLAHPQGSGVRDALSHTLFPLMPFADIFPSAPIPVQGVPMDEISSIGQRYQQCLSRLELAFGATEARHFREHFFPRLQSEPVFELGYALDAKAHITSTIMEKVTKQRLLLCLPADSPFLKHFNYQVFRTFTLALISSACGHFAAAGSDNISNAPTVFIEELITHAGAIKSMLNDRCAKAEQYIVESLDGHTQAPDYHWFHAVFIPTCKACCHHIVTGHFLVSQIRLLEELCGSLPNITELMRLLGADIVPPMSNVPLSMGSIREINLTPSLYYT